MRVYRSALTSEEAAVLALPDSVSRLAQLPSARRTPAQATKLRECFLDQYAPDALRAAHKEVLDLRAERDRMIDSFPTVMVMQDSPTPRETHVLLRGAYDRPGERVDPGVPSVLPPLPSGAPQNRLGLAKWLVDPSNPLTARVAVNRFWQNLFGVGLVKTVEDFGSQGEWPSHPELLDWLATEFVRTGWDMKAIQKTIVMSATYRQESKVTPELLQRDPENRLLARGPRVRLPAEMVRDQALAISGLLVDKIGGPSVKPYQPAGLWKELSGGDDYKPDTGEGLHRRSLYTYWKRTAPPPMMMNFDAAGRETCVVRELRTNTPLQALNLMNDVTYLEAARKMAERMMREGGAHAGNAHRVWLRARHGPNAWRARVPDAGGEPGAFIGTNSRQILTAAARYLSQGRSAPRRQAGRARAGGLYGGGQPDPQPGSSGHQGMNMDRQLLTRRYFFGNASAGLGIAALSSLLQADEAGGLPGLPHFPPTAKRVIYLFQSGAPSQMDLFDYKPRLKDLTGTELPDSVRSGQRLTGMTSGQTSFPVAPSLFQFAQHGKSGAWVSELMPHVAKVADDLCFIKSMYTEAINHDPAVTFFQTGFQLAGRPASAHGSPTGWGARTRICRRSW